MTKKRPVKESMSLRLARGRKAVERHRFVSFVGGRGVSALLLGTALSVGGVVDTMEGVHFVVQKDLDSVRVVRQKGENARVVAYLHGGFSSNTVFKLSQVLPERYVSRELSLFDP